MNRGFSLVEVIIGLVILEVGILATFGMILLSQRNFYRAEVTMRGVLEAGWIADSLFRSGSPGNGSLPRPWGRIGWSQEADPLAGLRFSVWSSVLDDTLARPFFVEPSHGFEPILPGAAGGGTIR